MSRSAHVLAGDIGGTKTHLAIFEEGERGLKMIRDHRFPSRNYPGLGPIVDHFLKAGREKPAVACFGIPGPVKNGEVRPSNLDWLVSERALEQTFGFSRVRILNDLEANAWGIGELTTDDLETIQVGDPSANGNRAIVSPGTGLGEAGLFWDGVKYHPVPSEGGHMDFAPQSEIEVALLKFLKKKYGHVSYERVSSGIGFGNLYEFLHSTKYAKPSPAVVKEIEKEDTGSVISRHALAKDCPLCIEAMNIFVRVLGAKCGNTALQFLAKGGMYVGGGIPAKILPRLKEPDFLEAFLDKGRLRPVMEAIPLHIILNENAALLGAARCAMDTLHQSEAKSAAATKHHTARAS